VHFKYCMIGLFALIGVPFPADTLALALCRHRSLNQTLLVA
jgi:hypothetical protein